MAKGPKLCTSCEHHHERAVSFNDSIIHECHKTVDLVTGKTKPTPCAIVRGRNHLCGEYGKWFKSVVPVYSSDEVPGLFDEPPVQFAESD